MKMNNKSVLVGLVALSFSFVASADVTDVIEKSYDFSNDGKVNLSNVNGDVRIDSCDCSQLQLKATIEASDQETRDRITIEIDADSDEISVKTKYAKRDKDWNNRNRHSKVTYELTVPSGVALSDIDLVNGDLTIEGVKGKLNANLVNGDLRSDGLTSNTEANTVNGDIKLVFSDLSDAGKIILNSVNGDIIASLPSHANAKVSAETVSGRISNEFGLKVNKHKWVGSDMEGVIGDGSVTIKMNNVNGRINLKSL